MKFCPLCYGNIEHRAEDFKVCKRCESVFDANGELIEQHNAHMTNAVAEHSSHVLYEKTDADAPDCIKDRNGDITLGLCKVCGKGEADLVEACTIDPNRQLKSPVVTESFAVMEAQTAVMEYCAVEVLSRNLATGEVRLTRIPLSEWPEWASELRPGHGS